MLSFRRGSCDGSAKKLFPVREQGGEVGEANGSIAIEIFWTTVAYVSSDANCEIHEANNPVAIQVVWVGFGFSIGRDVGRQ